MKKLILTLIVTTIGLGSVNAQDGLKGGAYFGMPLGKSANTFSLNYGAFATYYYPVFENFYAGGVAGIDFFSGKNISGTNLKSKGYTVLPIGASGLYSLYDQFFVSLDLGYALSLSRYYTGGFFFQPKAGWQNEDIQIFTYFKSTSSKLYFSGTSSKNFGNIVSIGIGGAYKF